MEKIKKNIKKIIGNINKVGLKNRDFTIISNNCWGGFTYQSFNLEYKTPFIGLFFFAPDYIELLERFDELIVKELVFINSSDSKYKAELIKNGAMDKYPIAKLGDDVEIHFMHYHSRQEAKEKWSNRLKRIDKDNMLVKFSDRDLCTDDLIRRFDRLDFKNKICFAAKEFKDCKSVITFKEFLGKEQVEDEWDYSKKYVNIKEILNSLRGK